MEIDISTLRTELEQRLSAAQEALDEVKAEDYEVDDDGGIFDFHDPDLAIAINYSQGIVDELESLLRWLKLYEEAARDGN